MKEKFEEPLIEIIQFSTEDVDVVASSGTGFFSVDPEKADK